MKMQAFKAALPHTLPIAVGFLFLGVSYGFLMRSMGFSFVYPMLMSLFIFAGSMEFVAAHLLLLPFNPWRALGLALMVNARHLFYGISMLDKYKGLGWKKPYLIFGMCDESFTINCTVKPPADVDSGWFMFFVTILNTFIGSWNSWLNASIYMAGDKKKWPIQLFINELTSANENFLETANPNYSRYLVQFSVIVVAILPIMIALPFFQDKIESGVLQGGVKE